MTKTTVSADLLEAFEIVTELGVYTVGENVGVLAIDDIALSVEKVGWDLVLEWVLEDGNDSLELCNFSSDPCAIDAFPLSRCVCLPLRW